MGALPFYLIFAVDPDCIGVPGQTSHFCYETDRRGLTTLDAAVTAVLDHDRFTLEAVWLCNPGAGTMTDATVEVLEELESTLENDAQYAPENVLPAMRRYGVRYREPLVEDDGDVDVQDHDRAYGRPALRLVAPRDPATTAAQMLASGLFRSNRGGA